MRPRPVRAVVHAGLIGTLLALGFAHPPHCPAWTSLGESPMLEPHTASLLVDYFETFLRDKDIEVFHRSVMARYTEGTLVRLASSGSLQARRASMLARSG